MIGEEIGWKVILVEVVIWMCLLCNDVGNWLFEKGEWLIV